MCRHRQISKFKVLSNGLKEKATLAGEPKSLFSGSRRSQTGLGEAGAPRPSLFGVVGDSGINLGPRGGSSGEEEHYLKFWGNPVGQGKPGGRLLGAGDNGKSSRGLTLSAHRDKEEQNMVTGFREKFWLIYFNFFEIALKSGWTATSESRRA